MNDIVKFGGAGTGLMTREDLGKSLNNVAMAAPRTGGEFQFLKMDKGNGDWVYGQEETVIEDGSHWAVNPQSFEYGYIAWDGNQQVEGEVMVPINRPLPAKSALRTNSADGSTTGQNGWQYQQSVVMACISGEDKGTQIQYKQSSVGSQKAFKSLIDAISGQIAKSSDAIVPIIEMKSDSYKHKKWGRIYNPVFEIVDWSTMDGNAPADEDKPAETEKPAEPARAPRVRGETAAPQTAKVEEPKPDDEEEAALAREYEAEQAAAASATPRRRVRR